MKKTKLFLVFAAFLFLGITTSFAQSNAQDQIVALGQQSKYYANQGESLVLDGTLTKESLKVRQVVYRTILQTVKKGASVEDAIDTTFSRLSSNASNTNSLVAPLDGIAVGKTDLEALRAEIDDLF